MFAAASDIGSASSLNCGLWRERGTLRTSISRVTPWPVSSLRNASIGRVEWPTVSTSQRASSALRGSTGEAAARDDGTARAARQRGGASAGDELADGAPQRGQEFIVEPGIGHEPGDVAGRRMRLGEQPVEPQLGAFAPRRQVAARGAPRVATVVALEAMRCWALQERGGVSTSKL